MARRAILHAFLAAAAGFAAAPSFAADNATVICTSGGNQYKIGDYACLPGCHGRQRYARCDAVAEAASWTFISDVCPMALRSLPAPGENSPVPVVTAMTEIPVQMAATPAAKEVQAQGPYCDDEFH